MSVTQSTGFVMVFHLKAKLVLLRRSAVKSSRATIQPNDLSLTEYLDHTNIQSRTQTHTNDHAETLDHTQRHTQTQTNTDDPHTIITNRI